MTVKELLALFKKHNDEFLEFENVEHKRSTRKDIHAFILLDELVPGTDDIVSAATHDEIFLAVGVEALAEKATEEQVVDLIRCGIRIDDHEEGLAMFV